MCLPSDASCNTYHLTWVSLTLDVGYLFHGCFSKAQPLLLTLDEGYLLSAAPPDLQCGIAFLVPPAPVEHSHHSLDVGLLLLAATPGSGAGWLLPATTADLWRGVAPLGRRPLRHGVLPASAPDLRRGVAPLSRA